MKNVTDKELEDYWTAGTMCNVTMFVVVVVGIGLYIAAIMGLMYYIPVFVEAAMGVNL